MADEKAKLLMKEHDEPDLKAQVAALTAQVSALLSAQKQAGGITADQLTTVMKEMARVQADAMREANEPDDIDYPRISVYSKPKGDRDDPRPPFKCQMFWAGYDLEHDTTTAAEIDLLNLAEPGEYTFHRIGGALEKLTVRGERNANGTLTKLWFDFPTKEQRDTLPSVVSMLRDAFRVKTPEQVELERLRAEVEALRTKATVAA